MGAGLYAVEAAPHHNMVMLWNVGETAARILVPAVPYAERNPLSPSKISFYCFCERYFLAQVFTAPRSLERACA